MISAPHGGEPSPLPDPLVEVRGLTKRFPGTLALNEVDLSVYPGEVTAVIGENGAGKSTLMKTLAGVLAPDGGQIQLEGREVSLTSVRQATSLGIILIHQELNLLANLTVAANIFLGREPNRWGWIDARTTHEGSSSVLSRVGLDVDPARLVSTLSIGQRQLVEVARALAANARLLIMDEPTSSLSDHEVETLFDVIRELKAKGVAVLYVSHRLGEVETIADRVLVLRDGEVTGRLADSEINRDTMVRCMVGRDITRLEGHKTHRSDRAALKVEQVQCGDSSISPVTFAINKGEIVGLAGLVGSGRSTLLRTLFGIESQTSGSVTVGDLEVRPGSARSAVAAGMGLVPEDRALQGLILAMDTRPNVSLGALHRNLVWGRFLNQPWEESASSDMVDRLGIAGVQKDKATRLLSGGNQQKVVLGKWLLLEPKVLLLDEPTRGIDLGAKQEIYQVIKELASNGMAILFASSEMEEILELSDRVMVMHRWQIAGELIRDELSEESIMHLATGNPAHG